MDSQGDDEAEKIGLTYSIPSDINRARPTLRTLVVCIIQVKALVHITALSAMTISNDDETAPGVISGAKPGTQAELLTKLSKDPVAAQSLTTLRHSFVKLCLDLHLTPSSAAEAAAFAQSGNCANRWYNSALQIVVFGNSKACLVFNFNAYLDGS